MKFLDPKEKPIDYSTIDLIRDLYRYAKPYRLGLVFGTVLRIICDLAALYRPIAFSLLVNELIKHGDKMGLHILLILVSWLFASTIRYSFAYLAKKIVYNIGLRIMSDSEKHMVAIMFTQDSAWHEKESSGAKIKRIDKGSLAYNDILRSWINVYVSVIVNFITIPFVFFKLDYRTSILIIIFLISYFIISKKLQKRGIEAHYKYNIEEEKINGLITESIGNIRTVRLLGLGDDILQKIGVLYRDMLAWGRERIMRFQFRGHFNAWYADVWRLTILGYVAYGIAKGQYEVGFIVLFSSYFVEIAQGIQELADISQDTVVSEQAIARMHALIGRDVPPEHGTLSFPKDWDAIEVKNLTFAYGGNEALKNVSFSVKKGERVGVVGLSGAGKSTLFKLLLNERSDYSGEISIGSIDIRDIKAKDFYQHVSVVPQETEVFDLSLKDNIIIGSQKKHAEHFETALSVSHVREFVQKLPQGLDTLIGERGVKLSGGEKQRLGIARAIYKDPSILLLDEATSHLDLESEEKIKDSLHQFFQNVTALVIAHRLTTIKEMDKIIVIEKGKILEQGSFDELYKKKGRFYELWEKQKFD
jgi:ABC-type multidrug transport system fused ATPase/permease subunit